MPNYALQHAPATGTGPTVACGSITVSQANNQITVTANPPGGGAGTNITSLVVFTPATGSNGTIFSPNAGDMMNLSTYTVTVGTNTYGFGNNATFRNPGNGLRGGFFTSAGIGGAIDDWDAADSGGPEPQGKY
jgi:hypothetical protein